ncbi:MAG: NIPSNAP family protein [Verrucomicrobia bacterium]|nr:NIPSNAP family protein [Verrucomicrobiota bacterium]
MNTVTTRTTLVFCLLAVLTTVSPKALAQKDERIFELRTYHTKPGKLDALLSRFRDHTVTLFKKHGMSNVAYWVPVKNGDQVLIYLMAYPSRKKRDEMWKAFANDPAWKAAYAASTKDGKLITKVDQVFLKATEWSPTFKIDKQNPNRLFEMRQYTTNPGKLPNIHARFRDHTIALFKKHGMTNLAYFRLLPDQDGANNTLLYFLAHKDEASRKKSFSAFGKDPDWQSARKASEVDGKILIKGGVKSTLMNSADFSPTQ